MASIGPSDVEVVLRREPTKEATVQTSAQGCGDAGASGQNMEFRAHVDSALSTHLVQLRNHLDSSLHLLTQRMDAVQGCLENMLFSNGHVGGTSLRGAQLATLLSSGRGPGADRMVASKLGRASSDPCNSELGVNRMVSEPCTSDADRMVSGPCAKEMARGISEPNRSVRFDDAVESLAVDARGCTSPTSRMSPSSRARYHRPARKSVGRTISEISMMRGLTKPLQTMSDKAALAIIQTKPQRNSRLFQLVKKPCFDLVFFAVILVNSAFIGVELQYSAHHVYEEPPVALKVLRLTFMLLFLVELLLRVAAERGEFFVSRDRVWNIFDFVLVISSVSEELCELSLADESMLQNLFLLRVGRVLRVMRIARVLRVMRTFTELRILINSIFCAVKQLFWTVILVVMIIYIVAVLLTQGAVDYQQSNPNNPAQEESELLLRSYGRLENSVYTLFLAFTGGADWADLLAPWFGVSAFYVTVFIAYIILMHFAVIHIVTAVFVESAVQTAQLDQEWNVRQETTQEKAFLGELRQIFQKDDGDETITLEELEDHLSDEKVRKRLRCLGLDISEACNLFRLLDVENKGFLECGEFALGCLRLRGQARSVDTALLIFEGKQMMRSVRALEQRITNLDLRMSVVAAEATAPRHRKEQEPSLASDEPPVAATPAAGGLRAPGGCLTGGCHAWRWAWPFLRP